MSHLLLQADARRLPLADESVDAIVCDPPYPEIDRPYGRMTETAWLEMMRRVVDEARRILKPKGSAVFILQPNSERVGRMRPWLWEFMAWTARTWNQIQDAWWWNFTAPPTVHANRDNGLMRPSLKACVWLGSDDCYRNQDEVLWDQSEANAAQNRSDRALRYYPSGLSVRRGRCASAADERGGVTPFNVIPVSNVDSRSSSGARGHPAGTPEQLLSWWTRYICPPCGVMCDPFCGAGTGPVIADGLGRHGIGCDLSRDYLNLATRRIERPHAPIPRSGRDEYHPLFNGVSV